MMSELPTTPPAPATTPTWSSKVAITTVLSALVGLPALLEQLDLAQVGIPPKIRAVMLLAAVVGGWLAQIMNRQSAEQGIKNAVGAARQDNLKVAEAAIAIGDPAQSNAEAVRDLRAVVSAGEEGGS
jgi:hypothetical protein